MWPGTIQGAWFGENWAELGKHMATGGVEVFVIALLVLWALLVVPAMVLDGRLVSECRTSISQPLSVSAPPRVHERTQ